MDNQKRTLANKYESATKKQRVAMLDLKCESNVNEIGEEEIASSGNIDHVATQETLDVQTKQLSEAKFIDINAGSGYDEKEEEVP